MHYKIIVIEKNFFKALLYPIIMYYIKTKENKTGSESDRKKKRKKGWLRG